MELFPSERLESLDTELQPSLDELDVGSFPQCVIHYTLVLIDSDGTGGVDDVSSGLGGRVTGIEGTEDELFLQVSQQLEISFGL
jgi:hypothetical protein